MSGLLLFSHCEMHFADVRNVEVRPAISTDTNPDAALTLYRMVMPLPIGTPFLKEKINN